MKLGHKKDGHTNSCAVPREIKIILRELTDKGKLWTRVASLTHEKNKHFKKDKKIQKCI